MTVTTIGIINIVLAAISIASTVVSTVIARRRLSNAAPPPDLARHPTADEGNPAPWLYGKFNRVRGQVIYLSRIRPVPIDGATKGKTPQTVVWNYQCNVAIAWCRNECALTPIRRIWASSELIFGEEVVFNISVTGVDLEAKSEWDAFVGFDGFAQPPNCRTYPDPRERKAREKQIMCFVLLKTSVEDAQFRSAFTQMANVDITISGATLAENNGVFRLEHIGFDSISTTENEWQMTLLRCTYQYPNAAQAVQPEDVCIPLNPSCGAATDDDNTPATVSFTIDGFSLYYPPGGLTNYPGTDIQFQDGTILSDPNISIDELPAFRGTCYTVIKDLDITKWASTLPQFEAEVRTTAAQTFVKDAFDAVIARNEATTSYKTDTSELDSILLPIFGIEILGPVAPVDSLNTLMQVYDVEAQERLVQFGFNRIPENVLFFVPRDDVPVNILDYELTSARETGSDGRVHAAVKRTTQDDLPNEFVLDYTEFERDLQPGTTSFTVSTGGVRNTQKLALKYVFTQPLADILCRQLMWKAIRFHDSIEFNLPPKQYGITEGDRLRLETPSDGLPIEARVTDITIGENGLLEVVCEIDDDLAYDQLEGGGYSDTDDTQVVIPDLGQLVFMDMAPLLSSEATRFGLHIVNRIVSIPAATTYQVYVSLDQINWSSPLSLQNAGVVGTASDILEAPDDVHQWDFLNTVTIDLLSDTVLESVSQEDVEMGMNWAYLGREIIGFMTATPTADPRTYVLSGLLRGRNNSEEAAETHFVNQTFVLLPPSSGAVAFIDLQPAQFMQQIFLALAPTGVAVQDAVVTIATPAAETLRPYSVHGMWGFKRPNGDTCVFATTRTRVPFRLLSALIPPFVETGPVTDYKADVYWLNTPTTWEFLRQVEACQAPQNQIGFEYTSEQQVVDLVDTGKIATPDPTVRFRFVMYRESDSIGAGRSVEFCIEDIGAEYIGSCEFD